jgi:DNA-binding response OmpR family regulator
MATRSVVLVDDRPDLLELMTTCFRDRGFQTRSAQNGFELMKLLKETDKPCLVVLDLMMPERSGLDLISVVRGFWTDTKIIIYTAFEGRLIEELKTCADAVVLKTTPIHEMVKYAEELLES